MGHRPLAVSLKDAVHITGLSRTTLYRYTKAGRLPVVVAGGRTLVRVEALDALLRSMEVQHEAA